MKPILEIKEISKKFQIQGNTKPYLSLRENLFSFIKPGQKKEEFWALNNVSFNVEQGDTVGIIGKNGAGKSTLLKILSKITPPTSGKIICRGRIASLLEVGTGFHPELSGRENIFMNGSILGMRKTEILKNFDAIVDFSGVEKFIDTPLKHYSSGMQLRLAFAVAAFLENEILIIDEVLAVGDAEFQKKCLGKMGDISKSGRTILFVSHNINAVKSLCNKGILLEHGKLICKDTSKIVVEKYLNQEMAIANKYIAPKELSIGAFVNSISIKNHEGNSLNFLPISNDWKVEIEITVNENIPHFIIAAGFTNNENIPIRTTWTKPINIKPGKYLIVFNEDKIYLGAGIYNLHVGLSSREQVIQYLENILNVEFDTYVNKEISLRSDSGVILNQMNYTLNEIIQ
ncbi:MAG: polysaccharide ABC transporter ATP-binding protein [Bacteroidota bacterium]|nr:polysaccharide ABC transporter ATP-binding protein [Bacteroidota bacterium]MDP3144471.1 polysaccharide ABC transporter ATP-binding protein [Bacteroidota bacterium]MDP3555851.1 polysaccharide ABC transporter ATP-binding protein [Bacteroidota bacterium]